MEEHVWAAGAFCWVMGRTTLPKAKAMPIAGMNVKPMRSAGFVRGLPDLVQPSRAADRVRCQQHSLLIDWGITVRGTMFALDNAALEENPDGSWLWGFPEQQKLTEM